jgi:hypothetical protein
LAHGISALAILAAISANGALGHHYVVDPFQKNYANCGEAMITLGGFADRHTFLERFPEEVVPQLQRLQFAFIDASHLFDFTMMEFVLVDKKLEVGGLIALYDLWMPSLQTVLRFIHTNRGVSDSPRLFGPSSNSYLAAAIHRVCQPRPQKTSRNQAAAEPRAPGSLVRISAEQPGVPGKGSGRFPVTGDFIGNSEPKEPKHSWDFSRASKSHKRGKLAISDNNNYCNYW